MNAEYETRQVAAFTVVGLAGRQSNDRPELIGKQWQDFFASGGPAQIPDRKSDDLFAVYTDYEGDYTQPYTMIIGCEVSRASSLPKGLVAKSVQSAKYAVIDARGPQPQSVVAAWKKVYGLPLSRAYTSDFDRYRGEDIEVFVAISDQRA
jgi:predicted transcriptional regulator YdeE